MNHYLKTINPYFEMSWKRLKTFEIRKNDREFKVGDMVQLQEFDSETNKYSGRELIGSIDYILNDFPALKKGYVVFSLTFIYRQGEK